MLPASAFKTDSERLEFAATVARRIEAAKARSI
jgi:hypothetical protein